MKDALDPELELLSARLALGELNGPAIADVALRRLEADPESEHWLEVAIVRSEILWDLEPPFRLALEREGVPIPDEAGAQRILARAIAWRIVHGEIEPVSAASKILMDARDRSAFPDFWRLFDEWDDRPPHPILEEIDKDIVEAAERLLRGEPPLSPRKRTHVEPPRTWWQRLFG